MQLELTDEQVRDLRDHWLHTSHISTLCRDWLALKARVDEAERYAMGVQDDRDSAYDRLNKCDGMVDEIHVLVYENRSLKARVDELEYKFSRISVTDDQQKSTLDTVNPQRMNDRGHAPEESVENRDSDIRELNVIIQQAKDMQQLRAELARLRPVVEAAEAFHAIYNEPVTQTRQEYRNWEERYSASKEALARAVDAMRAAKRETT